MLFSSPLGRAKKIISAIMKKDSLFDGCLIDSYKEKDVIDLYTVSPGGFVEEVGSYVHIYYTTDERLSASLSFNLVKEGDIRYESLKEVAECVDDDEYTVTLGKKDFGVEGSCLLLTVKGPVKETELSVTTSFLVSELSSILENYMDALAENMEEFENDSDEDDHEDAEEE